MYYHICVQNCFEDFYYENSYCGKFTSEEDAVNFLVSSDFVPPVFDVTGYIKWYFPSCDSDGIIKNPKPELDRRECYQIINIIPSRKKNEWITETYGDDDRSIYSEHHRYLLSYTGDVEWL